MLEGQNEKNARIAMDDVSKMSEAERLQLRKMRFSGTLGTDTTLEEAEKVCLTPRRSSRNA